MSMAKPRPSIYELRQSKTPYRDKEWKVAGYVDGKRKQHWFVTEKEARAALRDLNARLAAHGSELVLSTADRADAADALALLEPYKVSLTDAARGIYPSKRQEQLASP
jgi:hypothetical protein